MPDMVLCPKCHGQGTSFCLACNGTGQPRCDVCGGSGEVEPPPPAAPAPSSAVNEHQPSCFGLEEERGERWKGSGEQGRPLNEGESSLRWHPESAMSASGLKRTSVVRCTCLLLTQVTFSQRASGDSIFIFFRKIYVQCVEHVV